MNYEAVLFYKEQGAIIPPSISPSSADLSTVGTPRLTIDAYPNTPKPESVSFNIVYTLFSYRSQHSKILV